MGVRKISRGVWEIRFRYTAPGAPKMAEFKKRFAFSDKGDAVALFHRLKVAAHEGRLQTILRAAERSPDDDQPPTVAEFGEKWVDVYARSTNKPSEIANKEYVLRKHVYPRLGHLLLSEVNVLTIESYRAELSRSKTARGRPFSPKTINNHLAILGRMLQSAVEWELIADNPARRVRRAKIDRTPEDFDNFFVAEELVLFLETIRVHHPRWYPLLLTGAHTGLRQGELFGLKWRDVDFDGALLHVRRGVYRGVESTPKGGHAHTISLTPEVVEVLRSGPVGVADALVFARRDGRPLDGKTVEKPLFAAQARAGLPDRPSYIEGKQPQRWRTFHALRHSVGTALGRAGCSELVIAKVLGHRQVSTTKRYVNLGAVETRDAVDRLSALLGQIRKDCGATTGEGGEGGDGERAATRHPEGRSGGRWDT